MSFFRSFLADHVWSQRVPFAKYSAVGVSSFLFDISLLMLFTGIFNWRPVATVLLVQLIVVLYNFLLNKYWSFGARAWSHVQFIKYMALVGWNYAFSFVTMFVFNELLSFHYIPVRVATVALMVSWNFLLYRFWVYR